MSDRNIPRGLEKTLLFVVASIAVGAALGAATKGIFWFFRACIDLMFETLPDQLGVDGYSLPYMAAVLGVGGLLVGLGNKYLGYHPQALEVVTDTVRSGGEIDHKTIPQTLANSTVALGSGGPLGPESALVATIGGLYYWTKGSLEAWAKDAYIALFGESDSRAAKAWVWVPTGILVIALAAAFVLLPGGVSLAFVPSSDSSISEILLIGVAVGIAGTVLGVVSDRVETASRNRAFWRGRPLIMGVLGGLVVAVAATPSSLVLFSGTEFMEHLFDGTVSDGEMVYSALAKLVALTVVFGMGWKGGNIFPLMYISGALAVAAANWLGWDPVIMYAAGIAAAISAALGSMVFGIAATLLVAPPDLFLPMVIGGAVAGIYLRLMKRRASSSTPPDAAAQTSQDS